MSEIFLSNLQGSRLSLEVPPTRIPRSFLVSSPSIFFSNPRESLMVALPSFKDVPFLQEKLKSLKLLIRLDRKTVAIWESSEPFYPLLPKVKEQLKRNQKLLKEVLRP